jgi:hypothetical protein
LKHFTLAWRALTIGALLAPVLSHAEISCTREGLQQAVDLYVAAQSQGDLSSLPLAKGLGYWENIASADIKTGFVNKPLKIDHTFTIIDPDSCQTFSEIIVTDKSAPYVVGTRLRINHDKIAEIETLWTTTGYWLFNADAYLKYATEEKWGVIPKAKRTPRGQLVAAANAYLDAFLEKKTDLVPWGYPCHRTEGGAHTGKGLPTDSCADGVPAGVNIANRHFVVDEERGTVQVFCTFGASSQMETTAVPGEPAIVLQVRRSPGAPDSHMFRVENGKLRYVHTMTHLLQSAFRGNGGGGSSSSSASSPSGSAASSSGGGSAPK